MTSSTHSKSAQWFTSIDANRFQTLLHYLYNTYIQFYFFTMQTYKTRQLCNQTYICCMIKYPSHLLMNRSGSGHSFLARARPFWFLAQVFVGCQVCPIYVGQFLPDFARFFAHRQFLRFPKFGLVWITGQGLTQPYLGKSEKLCKGSLLV